jgi:hypothetical protein
MSNGEIIVRTSAGSADALNVLASGQAKGTLYNSAGTQLPTVANPLQTDEAPLLNLVRNTFAVSTFRTTGLASNPHILFTIENPLASGVRLGLLRMTVQGDSTAALATPVPVRSAKCLNISGGTILSPTGMVAARRAGGTSPVAAVKGATASDGGAATAITVVFRETIWGQFHDRQHELTIGNKLVQHEDLTLIPVQCRKLPLAVDPGEGVVAFTAANATTTTHWIVQCMWQEVTL